jgi:tungstate transport system ATP-binding protein
MTAFLEVRNLMVRRSGRIALEIDHLSLEVGKVSALVGPNGAGKSTLILVLAGLLKPAVGEILVRGKPITGLQSREYRRRIGLVMQEPLLLDMTAYDNIGIGLRFRHMAKMEISRRVAVWGERLGIEHLSKRRASTLSGGEAQRVALARAFVLQPELLLMDEPFGALDKKTRSGLIHDLKSLLPETGATTLFSTHDEREVNTLADHQFELDETHRVV